MVLLLLFAWRWVKGRLTIVLYGGQAADLARSGVVAEVEVDAAALRHAWTTSNFAGFAKAATRGGRGGDLAAEEGSGGMWSMAWKAVMCWHHAVVRGGKARKNILGSM